VLSVLFSTEGQVSDQPGTDPDFSWSASCRPSGTGSCQSGRAGREAPERLAAIYADAQARTAAYPAGGPVSREGSNVPRMPRAAMPASRSHPHSVLVEPARSRPDSSCRACLP